MLNQYQRVFPLISLLVMVPVLGNAAEPITNRLAPRQPTLAQLVQTSLGLPEAKGTFLPELAAALTALDTKGGGKAFDQAVNALADRAAKGADVDSFTPLLLKQLVISDGHPTVEKGWPYGGRDDRMKLYSFMWKRAIALEATDVERAKIFSRAAIVLAGHEDLVVGTLELSIFGQNLPRLVRVTQLAPQNAKSLESLLKVLNEESQKSAELFAGMMEAQASVIYSKERPLTRKAIDNYLDKIVAFHDYAVEMKGTRYTAEGETILSAWQLRNLVTAYGDDEAKAAVDSLLKRWQARVRMGSVEERWVDEALKTTGKPLTRSQVLGPGAGAVPSTGDGALKQTAKLVKTPLGVASWMVMIAVLACARWWHVKSSKPIRQEEPN